MILQGTPQELEETISERCPAAFDAYVNSVHIPAQMLPYQALALYALATRYNVAGANILEIGTAAGFSASLLAQAAPLATIVTLNPRDWEVATATNYLEPWPNVTAVQAVSWDYLASYQGPQLDMVFVDGDHNRVPKDLPWFNWLKIGGLMLFHDYSEAACPAVYRTVNQLVLDLDRLLDVKIIDNEKIGMAGFYRWDGEVWLI